MHQDQPRPSPVVWRLFKTIALAAAALVLQGCVYLPVTTQVYDPECRVTAQQMALQPVQIAALGGCSNEGCAVLLAAAGATAAASAIISGSIVAVGNMVHWFEKQGRCVRGN